MKRVNVAFLCLILFGCCLLAAAQDKKSSPKTVAQVLDGGLSSTEGEFVPAAEAMPEDKYSFAPTNGEFKGVRTFAEQVKHVASVNYIVAGTILGEKPPVDTGGEKGPTGITSKADIVKYLKDSFVYAHKAVNSITDQNMITPIKGPFGDEPVTRLGMATVFSWHSFDHYGQMVEYLRMNGVIPPASRQ